jgi:hypothetical protein
VDLGPAGQVFWDATGLAFRAVDTSSTDFNSVVMTVAFPDSHIPPVPGEFLPPSLDGLSTDGAFGGGGTNPYGHGFQVSFSAVPEPGSGVLSLQLGVTGLLAVLATRWTRRKAAAGN